MLTVWVICTGDDDTATIEIRSREGEVQCVVGTELARNLVHDLRTIPFKVVIAIARLMASAFGSLARFRWIALTLAGYNSVLGPLLTFLTTRKQPEMF